MNSPSFSPHTFSECSVSSTDPDKHNVNLMIHLCHILTLAAVHKHLLLKLKLCHIMSTLCSTSMSPVGFFPRWGAGPWPRPVLWTCWGWCWRPCEGPCTPDTGRWKRLDTFPFLPHSWSLDICCEDVFQTKIIMFLCVCFCSQSIFLGDFCLHDVVCNDVCFGCIFRRSVQSDYIPMDFRSPSKLVVFTQRCVYFISEWYSLSFWRVQWDGLLKKTNT